MLTKVFTRLPKWQMDNFREVAKKNKLTTADLIRLATYFFVLEYKGKYDKETIDRMEFKARKKVED